MGFSRYFCSKKLKPVEVSLKPWVFGGVGGLTPGWALGPSFGPQTVGVHRREKIKKYEGVYTETLI